MAVNPRIKITRSLFSTCGIILPMVLFYYINYYHIVDVGKHGRVIEAHSNVTNNIQTTISDIITLDETTSAIQTIDNDVITQPVISTCSQLSKIQIGPVIPDTDQWSIIDPYISWVYSIHLDPRRSSGVVLHVTGLMNRTLIADRDTTLYCLLWSPGGALVQQTQGIIKRPLLKIAYQFETLIVECRFAEDVAYEEKMTASVVSKSCTPPRHRLAIMDNREDEHVHFSVCICGSLRGNYSSHQQFIEWMELNHLLGVGRTIVYETSIAPNMVPVLRYYTKSRRLVNVQWHPPDVDVMKYAYLAMVYDCLMRSMLKSDYVAFLDVDEFIIPQSVDQLTWSEMIESSECRNSSYITAQNTLYFTDLPDDQLYKVDPNVADSWQLNTLFKTKRDPISMEVGLRSKNIIKPENIKKLKLHNVKLRNDIDEERCALKPHEGLLHHYRVGGEGRTDWVIDRTAHKYHTPLITAVHHVYTQLDRRI